MGVSTRPLRFAGWVCMGLALGCQQQLTVRVNGGPVEFELAAASLQWPAAFQRDGRIPEVPCVSPADCPSVPEPLMLSCAAGQCDPDPTALSAPVGDVIDFEWYVDDVRDLLAQVDRIRIEEITFRIAENTFNLDLAPAELYWGPASATTIDPSMGVLLLGSMPGVPAGAAPTGNVTVNERGNDALSDHLTRVDPRVRFFVRSEVDVEPGMPVPAGRLRGAVRLRIALSGPRL